MLSRLRSRGRRPGGPRLVAVNLYHGGHHPQHLESLRAYWAQQAPAGELHFVVSEPYREHHPELVDAIDSTRCARCHLVPASNLPTNRATQLLRSDRLHGRTVATWAAALGADHVLLMYLDHVQLSLAFDLRFEWPVGISGILFRPTFHYPDVGIEQSLRDRVAAVRKHVVLRAALRNPHLRYVFCFDELAVERFPRARSRSEPVALPEPLDESASRPDAGSQIAGRVEPGRRTLLVFGSLDERKGIDVLLGALSGLDPSDQARLALVLAGRVSGSGRERFLSRIEAFGAASRVQIVLEDRYLEESEIQPLIRASDLVLLTYVFHVGSSGVLVRAAHAGVPVLSTAHGLLRHQVRKHRLGGVVDTPSAHAVRAALERWLASPESIGFDADAARAFARANTSNAFAETIFARLLDQPRAAAR